jgi:hypothetical protein
MIGGPAARSRASQQGSIGRPDREQQARENQIKNSRIRYGDWNQYLKQFRTFLIG